MLSDIIGNILLLKLSTTSSLALSKIFAFFLKKNFSDNFIPLFKLPNILNKPLCSLLAFSFDKLFVYTSLTNIDGNENLLKS